MGIICRTLLESTCNASAISSDVEPSFSNRTISNRLMSSSGLSFAFAIASSRVAGAMNWLSDNYTSVWVVNKVVITN